METQVQIGSDQKEIMEWPKVAIIVLNWNGWKDTIECLESLQRIIYPNYQIIVVDNGSKDKSVDKIRAWAASRPKASSEPFIDLIQKSIAIVEYNRSKLEEICLGSCEENLDRLPSAQRMILILNEENLGFAAGNNIAIKYSLIKKYPYICLLNNDTVVDPDFLSHLILSLEENPSLLAVSPKILYKEDPIRIWYAGGKLNLCKAKALHLGINQIDSNFWSGIHSTEVCTGCCLVARHRLFETVGLFDEEFFFGHEDGAYSYNVRKHGLLLGVNLNAKIYHKFGGSHGRKNPIYVYYYNKNRLLILKKYGSFGEQILGFSFYALTRPIKFLLWIASGKTELVQAELQAIRDFLCGRHGDYDRRMANTYA